MRARHPHELVSPEALKRLGVARDGVLVGGHALSYRFRNLLAHGGVVVVDVLVCSLLSVRTEREVREDRGAWRSFAALLGPGLLDPGFALAKLLRGPATHGPAPSVLGRTPIGRLNAAADHELRPALLDGLGPNRTEAIYGLA